MNKFLTLFVAFLLVFGTVGCGGTPTTKSDTTPSEEDNSGTQGDKKNIVEVAMANDNFKTLVAAVKAAALVEALQGDGPFTVFAPTDEAFKKLPEEKLEDLLKPENKDKLAGILKYHVVAGKVMAADALKMDGKEAETLEGSKLKITVKDGTVMVDNAKVVKADIECENGVIHVIDAVVLPKSE